MTIVGILGSIGGMQSSFAQQPDACGCGKTTALSFMGYSEYTGNNERNIVANFHTRFPGAQWGTQSWSTYLTAQQIFDRWWDDDLKGSMILITELQSLLNSAARQNKLITYIEKCLQQRRKKGYDIIWDSQMLGSADLRIREYTQYIYQPVKFHCMYDPDVKSYVPTQPCLTDKCKENHLICLYRVKPAPISIQEKITPVFILKAWEVGQLFDTEEPMKQTLKYNPAWDNLDDDDPE